LVDVEEGVVAVGDDRGHVVAELLKLGPIYHANGPVANGLLQVALAAQFAGEQQAVLAIQFLVQAVFPGAAWGTVITRWGSSQRRPAMTLP
jgi:hypothetical protein